MRPSKPDPAPKDPQESCTEAGSDLRQQWIAFLETLYASVSENSGLQCESLCHARCCPKVKTPKNQAEAVGHVAIFLPFELENIVSKTGIEPDQFQTAQIEFTPGTPIDIGFITNDLPCPFLREDHRCGIYEFRPLDCRSFPLIPVFQSDGGLNFRVDHACPSAKTHFPTHQEHLKDIWRGLLPRLPMNYRKLYNDL